MAKGTAEQENLDNQADAEESAERARLDRLEKEESERKTNLRSKSKSIFNALYGR